MKAVIKKLARPVLISVAASVGPHRYRTSESRLWILMYHRILPAADERFLREEPGMKVRPEIFDMHLRELKRHFELVSLGAWVRARRNGEPLPVRACAITFDDGWLDNYQYALPLLQTHSVPATLFAVADKIGTDFQFWPNIVAALLSSGAGSQMSGHPLFSSAVASLGNSAAQFTGEQLARCIRQLKQHPDAAIYAALDDIGWRALCAQPMQPVLMDWEQLRAMQASGLVEIGSHSCTHRRLTGALTIDELTYEIATSKEVLQHKLGRSVELFCFPNGDYTDAALDLVQANYSAAVTTRRGINRECSLQLHELTRIGLHDDISNTRQLLNARLSGWV